MKPRSDLIARIERALANGLQPSSDFDLNQGIAGRTDLRSAAVLLPLVERAGGWHLVLTKRAGHLTHHPGQIALPGGRLDPGETHEQAALRETHEEIGIVPTSVALLGQLPDHQTVTGFAVRPFVGILSDDRPLAATSDEVSEVFDVPLGHILEPAHYRIEGRLWQGTFRRFYTVPVGSWYIWGATARILRQLAEGCAGED